MAIDLGFGLSFIQETKWLVNLPKVVFCDVLYFKGKSQAKIIKKSVIFLAS